MISSIETPTLRQLVLASNNGKKLLELSALFASLSVTLIAQGQLGIAETEEPYPTFIENALTKARHAAHHSGLPAIADDSGLCVQALGGLPGVRSARYAQDNGQGTGDADNNACLIHNMVHLNTHHDRQARFVSVLVAIRHANDPEPLIATGQWEGAILHAPQGDAGFGYDPLMWIESLQRSVAQLSAEEKNRLSHRAQACERMRHLMQNQWGWGKV